MSTSEERLLAALQQIKEGDFSARLPEDEPGMAGEIAAGFNALVLHMSNVISDVNRLNREMTVGRLGGQSEIQGLKGSWAETQKIVNALDWAITAHTRKTFPITSLIAQASLENPSDLPDPTDELNLLEQMIRGLAQGKVDVTPVDEEWASLKPEWI